MAETTGISWADATLNFWISCTKVSVGEHGACENCYAEKWAHRFGIEWGPHAERVKTKGWTAKIRKILKVARENGIARPFVFSNSLSDIFDNQVPIAWLREAFDLMRAHPDAIFLLLTKRPQNIIDRAMAAGGLPPNAAIGCTIVTQKEADRDAQHLMEAAHELHPIFTFFSMEPLMTAVDLTRVKAVIGGTVFTVDVLNNRALDGGKGIGRVGWVITGGESGAKARPAPAAWFQNIRDQCAAAGVAYHHKQNGEWLTEFQPHFDNHDSDAGYWLKETRAGRVVEWEDGTWSHRVGKDRAGRLLDGALHDARPEVACLT